MLLPPLRQEAAPPALWGADGDQAEMAGAGGGKEEDVKYICRECDTPCQLDTGATNEEAVFCPLDAVAADWVPDEQEQPNDPEEVLP